MYKADVLLVGFVLCRGKFRYGPVGHSGEILSHIHKKVEHKLHVIVR